MYRTTRSRRRRDKVRSVDFAMSAARPPLSTPTFNYPLRFVTQSGLAVVVNLHCNKRGRFAHARGDQRLCGNFVTGCIMAVRLLTIAFTTSSLLA